MMFSTKEYIAKKTGPFGIGRLQFLQELVDEFQSTDNEGMENFWELDFSLPRPFAPGNESSRCGTFAPWNFRTLELSLPLANRARNGSVVNCN